MDGAGGICLCQNRARRQRRLGEKQGISLAVRMEASAPLIRCHYRDLKGGVFSSATESRMCCGVHAAYECLFADASGALR